MNDTAVMEYDNVMHNCKLFKQASTKNVRKAEEISVAG